jgi:hypothetical protein
MSPTVRIDDEVWGWLQRLARPFEDTPNSVLRRVAGLDAGLPEVAASMTATEINLLRRRDSRTMRSGASTTVRLGQRITGEQLNRRYKLGAQHALYHRDGTFYEHLTEFPGVLCDPKGWVRYESQTQFSKDPRLNIGVKVNVPGGLLTHPRYQRFPGE